MADNTQLKSYRLLSIIQEYAHNGEAQEKVSKVYNEMKKDSMDERELTRRMAGILYDGLSFNNWPWN